MRALIQGESAQGESAIAFEAALMDAMMDIDRVATGTTPIHVTTALQVVTTTVFPY